MKNFYRRGFLRAGITGAAGIVALSPGMNTSTLKNVLYFANSVFQNEK